MGRPTVIDLFSGIGSFSLGLERAGAETILFCEIDPFCQRVLAQHWPGVPIADDVTAIQEFPQADVIVGGFPCQDVSRAGKRAGLAGTRSGLYRELVRAIRLVRPKHAIMENVAALLGDGLDIVLGDLAESRFDAEWDCVPAEAIGAPHERDRIWIVAHAQGSDDRCGNGGEEAGQEPEPGNSSCKATSANTASERCGQGRSRRPPDSFAWVRDEARWNASDAMREGLAQWEGKQPDAQSQLPSAQRTVVVDVWQSRWPCEPALLGVDDGVANRVDRTRCLGNTLLPQIPELIGRALFATTPPPPAGETAGEVGV